ncbi:MAG: hypothetical protein OQK24_01280 [Magnetovibrio sp.]|nr:hypothetical protein [Magnetovibrio sp.]
MMLQNLRTRLTNNPDYGWSLASSYGHMALNIIVQIALVPLYLSTLGKPQFGVLMIVISAINYLGLGVAWISSGVQRIMGEQFAVDDLPALMRTFGLTKYMFAGYAVITAICIYSTAWVLQDSFFADTPELRTEVLQMIGIGAIYVIVLYDLNVDRLVLISVGKQAWANILSIVSLLVFACAVIPILLNNGGLSEVMIAFLGGALVARALSHILVRKRGIRIRQPILSKDGTERAILKRLLGPMGLGYAVYGALLLTLLQADTLILGAIGGAALVADYILIWKIADVGMQILWRLPETLVPYLIQMDAKGEHKRMVRIYASAQKIMLALAAISGLSFALLGQTIVELWVGTENTPDLPWAYALAGGAIFWMVLARLPAVFAFSTVNLKPLVAVTGLETIAKVIFLFALFPTLGLYAPLVAINVIHILGIAFLYQRLYRPNMTTGTSFS